MEAELIELSDPGCPNRMALGDEPARGIHRRPSAQREVAIAQPSAHRSGRGQAEILDLLNFAETARIVDLGKIDVSSASVVSQVCGPRENSGKTNAEIAGTDRTPRVIR